MTDKEYTLLIIGVVALVNALLRFASFWLFSGSRKTPAFIDYLGKVLPFALVGMLVVYCFKDVSIVSAPHGLPELIAGALVVLLHLWKRNTLISITAGTLAYMFLVQVVFV